MVVSEIVSGGQTGVDRAALDVALALGLACGGWCPKGRRAEDGPIPARYPLRETAGAGYGERTRLNVRDSDATLVLARGAPAGGARLTVELAGDLGRPCLVVNMTPDSDAEILESGAAAVRAWLAENRVRVLNVAGPRESEAPGIGAEAAAFLADILRHSTRR